MLGIVHQSLQINHNIKKGRKSVKLRITGKTNNKNLYIDSLLLTNNNTTLVIDRNSTSFIEENGEYTLILRDIYIWAINDYNLFITTNTYLNEAEFQKFLNDSTGEFAIEDEAPVDYEITIDTIEIIE